ncbi:MAG: GNAT family N-acetyltransferase [Aeromicrobium erythreum]
MEPIVQARTGPELTAAEVYGIWRIRDAVFSVEQACTDPDVDGVDLLETCTHLWTEDEDGLTSYLRTFVTPAGLRKVGRVCTRADQRGRGLSGLLLDAVHARWGAEAEIHLGAQAYLHDWYASHGYVRSGPDFVEAGIDHVPMTRPPGPA